MQKKQHLLVPLMAVLLTGCHYQKEAASVGIIGGADGPTVIYITTSLSNTTIIVLIVLLVLGIAGIIALIKHKRRK